MSRRLTGCTAGRGPAAAGLLLLVLGGALMAWGLMGRGASDGAPPVQVRAAAVPPPALAPQHATATPLPASPPVRVRIPAAEVRTGPVPRLGLAADGTVEVPAVAQADRIGWYDKGVTPGEQGPAVLIGHYDTVNGPAVLRNVGRIKPGDRISVDRADGTTAVFTVRELQQVDKKSFPTQRVYGDTDRPELRLITCGGALVDGHRPDNIIVYADLTP